MKRNSIRICFLRISLQFHIHFARSAQPFNLFNQNSLFWTDSPSPHTYFQLIEQQVCTPKPRPKPPSRCRIKIDCCYAEHISQMCSKSNGIRLFSRTFQLYAILRVGRNVKANQIHADTFADGHRLSSIIQRSNTTQKIRSRNKKHANTYR